MADPVHTVISKVIFKGKFSIELCFKVIRDNTICHEKQENWWFLKGFNSFGKSAHYKPVSIISPTKNRGF